MTRAALLRLLLALGLFVGFAGGGVVLGNLVAGDQTETSGIDLGRRTPGEITPVGSDAPGGAFVPVDADGSGGGAGSSSGGGRGGTGADGSAGSDQPANGEAPDNGAAPESGDGAGDAEGDQELPVLEHEGLSRWLDACAEGAEPPESCPPGEGATVLGQLTYEEIPFEVDRIDEGAQAWLRGGCDEIPARALGRGSLQLVIWTTHPAAEVIVGIPGELPGRADRYSRPVDRRRNEWRRAADAGEVEASPACVHVELPGEGGYELRARATSVFEDLVAEATHRASCCAQEPGRPRLESDIDWEPEGAPNVTVRAPAGHGPERIAARVTIVTVDWGCRAQETTGLPDPSDEGRRIGMSSAYDPRWTHYDEIRTRFALTGNDLEPLREGQRYLVCVWWTEGNSDTVIAREQATLTLPNLLEYEIFLGRSQFSRNALNHVWSLSIGWPFDCETDFQARTVSPPEELPAEVPAEPRLLCASRGRRIPLVTEVAAGLVSAAGPREDEGPGGQGFLLLDTPQGDADTGGPRFGGGWIPLYSPFHPGLIAEVEILWRASNDGSAPGAPTAYRNPFDDATRLTGSEDFTDPLLLEGSFVTLDTGDPVHPTATANLVTNGPVAGQVRALTDEPGCESRVAAIGSGGPPYAVPLGEVCPGAEYRLVVQLVDPATIGGDAVSVSYYAYDPGDWPVDQDASYHVWPAGGFATSGLVADLTLEAEVVGPSREVFVDQYHLVVGGTPIASDVGQTCRPLDEPATFGATGLPLRATVPITATVIVSTHPECGQDRRGHLLSINGRTDISLVALATGATTQIEIGDELPRVRLRVTGIRYRVDADPVPVGSPRAELTR